MCSATGSPAERSSTPALPRFAPPYPWTAIDDAVRTTGGAILTGLLPADQRRTVNNQLTRYLRSRARVSGQPESGSDGYDRFLGFETIRLHGLIAKAPATAALIGDPDLVGWAGRHLAPAGEGISLNAAELIEIQPGEAKQPAHRDSDSWPEVPLGARPIVVNAIVALDPFTEENGATYVAPDSWRWERTRRATATEYARAVMDAGDAVLFRGDLIHRGGENRSAEPRRAISISYCVGWLRPVENSFLNIPIDTVAALPAELQALLGYRAHDATTTGGGLLGLYENGDPGNALPARS